MAKKSKSQRARASARRAERKEAAEAKQDDAAVDSTSVDSASGSDDKGGRKLFKKKEKEQAPAKNEASSKKVEKKSAKAPKKDGFFKQVRAEMKRVTWPTRQDVLRWSGVVVGALIFFGVYVFILDNWIVTPLLVAISSLGA